MSKNFVVTGHCFIPAHVAVEVSARTKAEAKKKALKLFKDRHPSVSIEDANDYGAAFDFEPNAVGSEKKLSI